jgi:hypothetical protein
MAFSTSKTTKHNADECALNVLLEAFYGPALARPRSAIARLEGENSVAAASSMYARGPVSSRSGAPLGCAMEGDLRVGGASAGAVP